MSLDVFRGATIAGMMMANNPGTWSSSYGVLKHAEWHGWTYTDTIFPFFLWIVGVAIPLALVRRMEQGVPRRELFQKILMRSLILVGIGLFLNAFPFYNFSKSEWLNLETLRLPGVLQRIGICYFFASLIVLFCSVRAQVLWALGLLGSYCLVMAVWSEPGFPKGGNLSNTIDGWLLGSHNYRSSKTWDPEGILSTLPAIVTVLLGVFTGYILRSKENAAEKTAWICVLGALLMWAGQLVALWMPINKPIWTSSFSLFMAGLAMIVFGVCHWIIDVKGYGKWFKPLAIYGMNAITVFVLAGVLGRLSIEIKVQSGGKPVALKTYFYDNLFGHLAAKGVIAPETASLFWAITYCFGLYLVAYVFYRKKWFVRF